MATETPNNTDRISVIDINDEMRSSYLDYAMSVIVSRALPDVRDGLKPVQRRILYAMHDQGMRPNSSYKKSARLVGEVLGKYHPHSDTSVYDAMVRMAQPFSMRNPLVDGQGNYGSVDGDPPAAMRYTECRLAPITGAMLSDIDRDTVDWRDNFDQSLQEPSVLPARLPNLLVNGAAGIAVGLATNIPPHNLSEICDAIIHLADHPDAGLDDLMNFVQGPDFPTGAHIWGISGVRDAFATGRGRIIVQASHKFEDTGVGDRQRIVFTALPYQVNKAVLISRIAEMITKRRLEGASEVRDESDRKGLRLVVELRRGASPEVVLNNLYRYTYLRNSFSANMIGLVGGVPRLLNLREALQHYIDFRREVVRRRSEFDLRKAQARCHILEGLRTAIDNLDAVIDVIRSAADVDAARVALMNFSPYQGDTPPGSEDHVGLSELQAQAILDMQLRRLAALEREKIENEYQELITLAQQLDELLASDLKITATVKTETAEMRAKYGTPRRTEVHQEELGDWRREDVEPHKEVVITLSRNGYIKRVEASTYRSQHRGGKGVKGQRMSKEGDVTPWIQVADTHDTLLMFTNKGRVFRVRVFELASDQSRQSRGMPVNNLIPALEPNEKVQGMLATNSVRADVYLVMATRRGLIKRLHLSLLRNLNRAGLICFHLLSGDELISVTMATEEDDIVMVSRDGISIRFNSTMVLARKRRSGGRRGMRLNPKDRLIGMVAVNNDTELMVVTTRGFGKISKLEHYRTQKPGGKGVKALKLSTRRGVVASVAAIATEVREDLSGRLFLLTEKAQVLRTNLGEIRSTGRVTQGVILAKPDTGDTISAIRVIAERFETAKELTEAEAEQIEHSNGEQGDGHDTSTTDAVDVDIENPSRTEPDQGPEHSATESD